MSNIRRQNWLIDRRRFLRGTGGVIALPLLDAMSPIGARAADSAAPRRSVFVYVPNGVNVETWQITKAGPDYELSEPLRPLARHRAVITPISGLHHPKALGVAHACAGSWLTGAHISQAEERVHNTVSCDQVIAEVTSAHTRFPSLELSLTAGVGRPAGSDTLAISRDGVPLPADANPGIVFNRLFGEHPHGKDAQRAENRRTRSVLDGLLDDARSLRRALGADDVCKLDEYLHSVRDVEKRTERLNAWLEVPKPKVEGAAFQKNVPKSEAGAYYRTMYDLILLALRTDMTRVVTYMSGTESVGLAIPEIGIVQTRHELSHHDGDPGVLASLTKSDRFIVEQFAYFMDQLQSVTEGDETLLDRTMLLLGSGMSHGHGHGNANLPTIFAGGRGLGVKHGQHLDYNLKKIPAYQPNKVVSVCYSPANGDARLSNLLLTMIQKMDVKTEQFADSLGPVSELCA